MICPECQARNSPAALQCHNCHGVLRDESDIRPASAPEKSAAENGRRRLRQCGLVVVIVALILAFALGGDWLGRRFVQEGNGAPHGRVALEVRYEQWKQAHAQPVVHLMDCYALEARIIRESGQTQTYNDLAQLAQSVRQIRTYDRVTDASLPLFAFEGDRAIVTARHRYGHSNPKFSPVLGNRVLIWEQQGGRWLIVEDRFPSSYTSTR